MIYKHILGFIALLSSVTNGATRKGGKVIGKLTHGLNVFNGEQVTIYPDNGVPVLSMMRAKDCSDTDSAGTPGDPITAETSRDMCLVSDNTLHNLFYGSGMNGAFEPSDPLLEQDLGVPFTKVGTFTMGVSSDPSLRQPVDPYNTGMGGFRVNPDWPIDGIKLGRLEQIRGKLFVRCGIDAEGDGDGVETSQLRFKIRSAIPNSVFTLWEMGVNNGAMNIAPPVFPNVIITDDYGNGEGVFFLPYCPLDLEIDTKDGVGRVLSYIFAWHLDFGFKGGVPDLGRFEPPSATAGVLSVDILDFTVFEHQT